jgi:hypothetical protein
MPHNQNVLPRITPFISLIFHLLSLIEFFNFLFIAILNRGEL